MWSIRLKGKKEINIKNRKRKAQRTVPMFRLTAWTSGRWCASRTAFAATRLPDSWSKLFSLSNRIFTDTVFLWGYGNKYRSISTCASPTPIVPGHGLWNTCTALTASVYCYLLLPSLFWPLNFCLRSSFIWEFAVGNWQWAVVVLCGVSFLIIENFSFEIFLHHIGTVGT